MKNFILSVLLILVFSVVSYSQVTQDITASGTVLSPITYSAAQNLNFGDIFPGVSKTIANTDGVNAGAFTLNGEGTKEVQVSITRPTELTGPAAATMPINFITGAGVIATAPTVAGVKTTQAGNVTINLVDGELFFFIGGTVVPAGNQTAGSYTGTVGFSTVYTGN